MIYKIAFKDNHVRPQTSDFCYTDILTQDASEDRDEVSSAEVDGFVHAIGISEDGQQLAVAYGEFAALYTKPFTKGEI